MGNLASAVDELLAVDAAGLPGSVAAELVLEIARQMNRLAAAKLALLEVVDRSGELSAEYGSTAAWYRSAGRLSPGMAGREVHLARDLSDAMPAMRAALADGEVSPAHAEVVARLRRDVPADGFAAAEAHLADAARCCSPIELARRLTHLRHQYAPDRVATDEADLWADRRLDLATTLDGLSVGKWEADPASQELILSAIHAASPPVTGDDRTPAQRRFDGLLTVCELALRSGDLPESGGVKPQVSVVVPLDTLAGEPGADAGRLAYGAPISGHGVRRLACDATIARIVLGPAGEVLDAGRATRTFSAAQRRAIVARDRHCAFPGCDAPPGWCDAHHIRHWSLGGPTSVANGLLLCGRHHDRVHHQRLAITRRPDGHYTVDPRPGSGTQNRDGP